MLQRALPFQYAQENTSTGMTSLSGLPAYVDTAEVSGLVESVRTHMIVREVRTGLDGCPDDHVADTAEHCRWGVCG